MTKTNNIISLYNINKRYKTHKKNVKVFDRLNLCINKEEFLCIFGPSGSGKTTLLNIISGLTDYNSGQVNIHVNHNKIGYVFQEHRLFPWLKVKDNLIVAIKDEEKIGIKQKLQIADRYLRLAKLQNKANSYPNQLSGGECKRISLLRSLINNPQILLLDEPFTHLDELTAQTLRNELKKICERKKITVVFVTHNPFEAVYLADRIVVLSRKLRKIKRTFDIQSNKKNGKNYIESVFFNNYAKKMVKLLINELDN